MLFNLNFPKEIENIKNKLGWICSIDWGWESGFVLSCFTKYNIIFLDAKTVNEELFPETVKNLQHIYATIPNIIFIADPGGSAKSLVETLRQTYSIPIQNAEKTDKFTHISHINKDLSVGLIKFYNIYNPTNPQDIELVKTCNSLVWRESKGVRIEGEPRHQQDAMLYAWRYWKKYHYREVPEPKEVISPQDYERRKVEDYFDRNRVKKTKQQIGW